MTDLENRMWEAAFHRDTEGFCKLVSPEAVMVCGGCRCLGREYAQIIKEFCISGYTISNMEIVDSGCDRVTLHYVIHVEAEDPAAKDLEGFFHIVSIWRNLEGNWQLIFNMDSRIAGK